MDTTFHFMSAEHSIWPVCMSQANVRYCQNSRAASQHVQSSSINCLTWVFKSWGIDCTNPCMYLLCLSSFLPVSFWNPWNRNVYETVSAALLQGQKLTTKYYSFSLRKVLLYFSHSSWGKAHNYDCCCDVYQRLVIGQSKTSELLPCSPVTPRLLSF